MLLQVIVSLWFHLSIQMMGRKRREHLTILTTFLRNHTTSMVTQWMHPLVFVWTMLMIQKMMCPKNFMKNKMKRRM
jgi:hypothetical protein